jgi:hypothetical protein
MSLPTKQTEEMCPNCKTVVLVNKNWCPHCGYNKHNIEFGGSNQGRYRFSWIWFLCLFILGPLASWGFLAFNMNNDVISAALILLMLSLGSGFILLIWNLLEGKNFS